MDQEIQDRISGYLDAVESSAASAGAFISEQTPLVAQECIAWVFWSGVLSAAGGLVMLAIIATVFLWAAKVRSIGDDIFDRGMAAVFVALISAVPATMTVFGIHNSVKATVAPRVLLLEKAAELLPK